jgi:hypothetical protein
MDKLHKSIILYAVFMGVKLCLLLREEHGFRLYENKVLRRIFGPKREEVTGSWRRLHNGELHNLYASTNVIRGPKLRG